MLTSHVKWTGNGQRFLRDVVFLAGFEATRLLATFFADFFATGFLATFRTGFLLTFFFAAGLVDFLATDFFATFFATFLLTTFRTGFPIIFLVAGFLISRVRILAFIDDNDLLSALPISEADCVLYILFNSATSAVVQAFAPARTTIFLFGFRVDAFLVALGIVILR